MPSPQMAQLADALSEAEKKEIKLSKEKELVEAKVKRIEKAMEQENKELKERLATLSGGVKEQLVAKTARIQEVRGWGNAGGAALGTWNAGREVRC